MTEEEKNTQENQIENRCFCQSKSFKRLLTTALGTFIGVYCALCLFTALHRPPMLPPCAGFGGFNPGPRAVVQCPYNHRHHFYREHKTDNFRFERDGKGQQLHPAPFSADRKND